MQQKEPGRGDPIGPLDWLKVVPFEAAATSGRLGWVGLQAVRYRAAPASELNPPAMTHHRLILFTRPPEKLDLRYEGVKRYLSPPAGSISLIPAGSPARYRWSSHLDSPVAAPAPPARPRHPPPDAIHEMAMHTSNFDPREGGVFMPRLLSNLVVSNSVDRATFENFETLRGGR